MKRYKDPIILIGALAVYVLLTYCFGLSCPIRFITGISCPGCGMTRSVISLCTLDAAAATYYHPMIWYLPPSIAMWLLCRHRRWKTAQAVLIGTSVALLLLVYAVRMWIVPSPVLQCSPQDGIIAQGIAYIIQTIP